MGGEGTDTPIDTGTRLSFEELLTLSEVLVDVEEGLPTDPDFGDPIYTTSTDVVGLGSVEYLGVGSYGEWDEGSDDFVAVYFAVGQFTANVEFTDGAASGEMFNFYEISNLDDFNAWNNSDDDDAAFTPVNGGGIEGQLAWSATLGASEFGDIIGALEQEDGTRLTRITGTLTKSDGTFANVDAPVFVGFYGPNAEILDGTNDSVGYNGEGEAIFVDYGVGFFAGKLPQD